MWLAFQLLHQKFNALPELWPQLFILQLFYVSKLTLVVNRSNQCDAIQITEEVLNGLPNAIFVEDIV